MNCVICLNNIEFNNKQTLSCEHIFHRECIIDWFKVKSNNCPICKCKNSNLIKNPIQNYINIRYTDFENLILNNLDKKWNYTQLTLNSNITKKFVKENPYIPWNIEKIYNIYTNDPELCELILQHQLNTISKKRLLNITKYVRISFILKYPNYNWNWEFISHDNDSDEESDEDNEESDEDNQYDEMTDDEIPNSNIELIDEDESEPEGEPESEDGESNELESEDEESNNYSIYINITNNRINIEINNSNTLLQNMFENSFRF